MIDTKTTAVVRLGMSRGAFIVFFLALAGASRGEPSHSTCVVGVKLMKAAPRQSQPPFQIHLPADCPDCSVINDPAFLGENPREIFFHLRVPADTPLIRHLRVDTDGVPVRTVIVEKNHIPFTSVDAGIVFDLPVVPRPRSSTVELQTSLESPGIVLRIEHAFPDRRAGKYATGDFPVVQRAAALNLEFGLREALHYLKLDREVVDRGLGKIHLMGFDTNNPLGHEDYPPHIHLILRWPHFAGSQAPHYYLDSQGLLQPDVSVTLDGLPHIQATQIGKGVWLPAIDYLGATLYETLVTTGGGISLRKPGGASCTLEPLDKGTRGFASGAAVHCGEDVQYHVRAIDDTVQGEVRVTIDARPLEIYRYDVDTAVLR
jgi:hypothetical protein